MTQLPPPRLKQVTSKQVLWRKVRHGCLTFSCSGYIWIACVWMQMLHPHTEEINIIVFFLCLNNTSDSRSSRLPDYICALVFTLNIYMFIKLDFCTRGTRCMPSTQAACLKRARKFNKNFLAYIKNCDHYSSMTLAYHLSTFSRNFFVMTTLPRHMSNSP